MQDSSQTKVWDPLVRVFHWTLAGAFAAAYLSAEEWVSLHTLAGYLVLGVVVFRILWGFIGTRHARFTDFVCAPSAAIAYVGDLLRRRARRYLGHNPAGGLMVLALMAGLLATGITGMAVHGVENGAGPLAGFVSGLSHYWEEAFEEVHEFFANFTLLLVFVHVAGVMVESLVHRESLVAAMLTGRKEVRDAD